VTAPAGLRQQISELISSGQLPADLDGLIAQLREKSGRFISQEGPTWDFKQEWPPSYSDEYFGGIARLICAFANTEGGIIIFGVHDKTRTAGHNRVEPDMDRLQQALRLLLTDEPTLSLRRYAVASPDAIDIVLVKPISSEQMPIKFKRSIGSYASGVIWVRQNHEVLSAEPRHVATLYCRAGAQLENLDTAISGGLPPSPATIRRFVGRIPTIDEIFRWLKLSDEPRTFLFGKGGSGKTTIAYEVAKVLKQEGAGFKIYDGEQLDNVIFVSGKQRTLNVMRQEATSFVGLDFSSERELYEAILTLANWTSEPITELNLEDLKAEVQALFDLTSNFVVIDDIDTLTTRGLEGGFDFLYRVLWRAKRKSKILYTIRNAPSQSLANSIEVPGLGLEDFEEFVRVCANQFGVPTPTTGFMNGRLSTLSERRPLVIESIIAIRRTSGTYDRAVQLFEESSGGEDVRNYVFQREWTSLPADNHGRYVLAILALFREPMAFSDIATLTRYDDASVKDALADIREMFLHVNEVGHETTFQLGELTKAFVLEQSKRLELYPALKARVEKYKRSFYPENPILSRLQDKVENLVYKGSRFNDQDALKQALSLVTDSSLSPKITEDPRFISLQGAVYAAQKPSRLDDARRSFRHVVAMKYEPKTEHLKSWYYAERDSGYGMSECLSIADLVAQGKRYNEDDKIDFLAKKATTLFQRGRNEIYSSAQGINDLLEALILHIACYTKGLNADSPKAEVSKRYLRNTANVLFQFLISNSQFDTFINCLNQIAETQNKLDVLEDSMRVAIGMLERVNPTRADLNKIRNRLEHTSRLILEKKKWDDGWALARLTSAMEGAKQAIAARLK
jgi:hypothetical protein